MLMIRITFSLLENFLLWFKMDSPRHPKSFRFGFSHWFHTTCVIWRSFHAHLHTHICASLINQKHFHFFIFPSAFSFSFISTVVLMADGEWWFMFCWSRFTLIANQKISFSQSLLFYWRFVFKFFLPFSHNMNPIAHSVNASENIHFDYIRTYYHFIYVRCTITSKGMNSALQWKKLRANERTNERNRHT